MDQEVAMLMQKNKMKEKSEIVRKGYDRIARTYHEQRGRYPDKRLLAMISSRLKKGSSVLDLGCGAGVPVARYLVKKGFRVTGIDFSPSMVRFARRNVPKARFILMDITKMRFKPDSFNGAVSFYAIIHIPREKHAKIYKKLYRILKPGSFILLNACGTDVNGWEEYAEDYLGAPMFWSFYGPKKTSQMIASAGFDILWGRILSLGGEKQFWVLAKKVRK
jgi:ubiquinone/menaquinone biosynthesis C-methylase UbiE